MQRRPFRHLIGALVVGLLACPAAWAATYTIDPAHSTIGFRIRHLFSYVQGTFNEFDAAFDYDPDHPELWKAHAVIQAASIDTRVEKRDTHLRSKDFFDAEQFPTIVFRTTGASDYHDGHAKLKGVLSMHGVDQPVVLDVTVHGVAKDPWGNIRSGFTATVTLNRKDFGLTWNQTLETGQLLVGEEVEVTIEVEGVLKS